MNKLNTETNNIIILLKTSEVYASSQLIIPFCQGCYNGPKPIKTIQENNQFLGSILPTIQEQLPKREEWQKVFLPHQDKPNFWNIVREVWVDEKYFYCRFCVPIRTHPEYRKFFLFDNRFFYLDQKWKKAAQRYYQLEQERKIQENKKNKCYYCYKNKPSCKLVNWNKNTLAYQQFGESTYICTDCDRFLNASESRQILTLTKKIM